MNELSTQKSIAMQCKRMYKFSGLLFLLLLPIFLSAQEKEIGRAHV